VGGERVRYSLTLWPAALPAPAAEQIRRAQGGDAAAREALTALLRERVTLTAQGRRCTPGPGGIEPAGASESLTVAVEFDCGATVRELAIRDDLFDVLGADYHTLARIDTPGAATQFAFSPDARETRVTVGAADRGLMSFVLLGVEHILTGWDHLLFLVVLLLRGGGWLSLAKIVTAFTVAHSVTLALAVLDVVTLPDRLVEAVIALSIAAVAAENLVVSPVVGRRWVVSLCFGLVHGFGFSAALRELGLPAHGLLLSLFGFNTGVEIGQALVVAVALPSLALLRRTRWEPRMVWGSSLAILLVGIVLFVERAFF
ncbi:MAG TPA: HupE/UreJ family protein, partial [Methylomirabilota bacterium]|nr:HupE/UreJ family protein [Methylomirabilota bacterium]